MTGHVGLGNHVENNHELVTHSFDLFAPNLVEKSMDRGYEQEIRTTTGLNDHGPYEFIIPPSSDYIHLPHTRLHIQGKITKGDGTDPAAADAYTLVNLFPQALFRQVDVHIGGINTSSQDGLYPYKAYFETLFSYSKSSKDSHLAGCSAWIDDDHGHQDDLANTNTAYTKRRNLASPGQTFDFCVPLHADVFQCPKLIPPKTPIKIVLTRSLDKFCILSAADSNFKVHFSNLSLYVRRVIPNEQLGRLYESQLEKKEVVLPFSRSILKRETVSNNITNVHMPLFNGEMPRQILMAMVLSTRLDGSQNVTPFYFQPFKVRYVNLRINGMSEPAKPYEPDFANGLFTRELRALYDNTGILNGDSGFAISRQEFAKGKTFFAWDLTPDLCNGHHIHDKKIGKTIDLDIAFSEGLAAPINILIYATYETEIKLLAGQVIESNFING